MMLGAERRLGHAVVASRDSSSRDCERLSALLTVTGPYLSFEQCEQRLQAAVAQQGEQ
jgi:hypothetical protein